MSILYKNNRLKAIITNYDSLFLILYNIRAYAFYFLNRISHYWLEKRKFYRKLGYPVNLKNPQSFNEKIIWKKIHDRNPLLPITADKYEVRFYIKEFLGKERAKEMLIPLLYVTDKPETIPFKNLPSSFIVKPNHASGRNIIVKNAYFDEKEIIKTCQKFLKTPYGLEKLEWAYQPIKRKIIIEKLLLEDGKIPTDFMFYMFHGKCKFVLVLFDKMNNPLRSAFDEKWNFLPVKKPNYPQGPNIDKPRNYEMMRELAEKLSKPFDFVRVDLYNLNGKIYFGELTHYSVSGTGKFEPGDFDFELGKYWKIKPEYWKKVKN